MMEGLHQLWSRLKALFGRRPAGDDIEDELRFHIEMRAAKLGGTGTSDPRREARQRFGNPIGLRDRVREVWRFRLLDQVVGDARYAVRSLGRTPAFTVMALLIVALTLGGLSAVFTVVHSVLLEPLPYPESRRLVRITQANPDRGVLSILSSVNLLDFEDIRSRARTFDLMAGYNAGSYVFDRDTSPYRVELTTVTDDFFELMQPPLLLGRGLVPDDQDPANPQVAVVSYEFWQERLSAGDEVVGTPIRLPYQADGEERSLELVVVGIVAPDFRMPGPLLGRAAIWTTLDRREPRRTRELFYGDAVDVIGRLREGATLEGARQELATISSQLAQAWPETNDGRLTNAALLIDDVVGDSGRILWIFFGAAALVLLIGVADLTSLHVVRNSARARELHVRAALGAGRIRLTGQLLVEAVVLAGGGAILGLLFALWGTRFVVSLLPAQFPRVEEIAVDPVVLLFMLVVSLATGIVLATLGAGGVRPTALAISEGGPGTTMGPRRKRLQRLLIAAETMLALVLLVGATLLTHSLWRLISEDSGMDERNLWVAEVLLPSTYREVPLDFWPRLAAEVGSLGEVEAVGATTSRPPLSGSNNTRFGIYPEGQTGDSFGGPNMVWRAVTPGYFETLGIAVRGRTIDAADVDGAERVAVLNEAAARLLWPEGDALGQRMGESPTWTVVGIIPDSRVSLDRPPSPQMYTAAAQEIGPGIGPQYRGSLLVRTQPGTGSGFADGLRAVIATQTESAETTISTMSGIRWQAVQEERYRAGILLAFAGTALLLAVLGVFGVVAYTAVQRQREIGLRIALGAHGSDVRRLVLSEAILPVSFGLVAGLGASLALTRFLQSFLYGISPTDPATLAAALGLFVVAAGLAAFLPARQAAQTDPMTVLRQD